MAMKIRYKKYQVKIVSDLQYESISVIYKVDVLSFIREFSQIWEEILPHLFVISGTKQVCLGSRIGPRSVFLLKIV